MDESPITLGASMGLSFFLAIGIVYAVQGVKWLCEILPTTKTNFLPPWVWVGTALVIAGATCYLLKVDALAAIGVDVGIYPPLSYLATGLAIGISSNVVYAVSKPIRKKLKTDEGKILRLPVGEEPPEPCPPVSQNGDISNTGNMAATGNNSQNGNRNSPDGQESQQMSNNDGNFIQPTVSKSAQDAEQSTEYVEQSATYLAESTSNSVNVVSLQPDEGVPKLVHPPAYLLNQCDSDPEIGPHFVLLDGRLYRVEHGCMTHLVKGWAVTANKE